jgi:hypothetical protein
MKQATSLAFKFVQAIPEKLEDRTLYVSLDYATAVHKCCCGCGREVITPLSPTDWKVTYDGESVSLSPSIGNWNFECRSHYWIHKSTVQWARQWSKAEIEAGRAHDRRAKANQYAGAGWATQSAGRAAHAESGGGIWSWLSRLFSH